MQPVVVVLFVLMIAVFVTGVVFVHSAGKRILAGEGSPWPYTIVYSAGVAVTALVFGFITLVALNR